MEVEMKIRGLMMDPVTNTPIVILKDAGGETVLPIWVGVYEANAIALEIEKVTTPRPMTHDLIKNVLTGLEAQVHKVVVTELREDTFYAVIWLECEGQAISIDSRPSDALALALRVDCPIFVEEEVLKTSKKATTTADQVTSEELGKWLEGLGDDDLGRYKMWEAGASVGDPAELLQRIYLAGFEFQTFDRYAKCVGVVRDGCVALLVPGSDGFQMLGTPGWRMGEVMGVLVDRDGRQVFQAKDELVEATPERLEALRRFREDLAGLLRDDRLEQGRSTPDPSAR